MKFFDVLPDDKYGKVTYGGRNFEWNNWGEVLEPETTSTVLATYIDQYYKKGAAAVEKKWAKEPSRILVWRPNPSKWKGADENPVRKSDGTNPG